MKGQEGIVLSVHNGMAKVRTSRHSDCENCGSCPGNSALVLDARNPLGAKPGQWVMIEVQEIGMLKSAFIVYMLPLIAVFIGVMIGGYLAGQLGSDLLNFEIGGGVLAFAVAILYVKYFDRSAGANVNMQPVITKILAQ